MRRFFKTYYTAIIAWFLTLWFGYYSLVLSNHDLLLQDPTNTKIITRQERGDMVYCIAYRRFKWLPFWRKGWSRYSSLEEAQHVRFQIITYSSRITTEWKDIE
jgi:hypothetical protein